MNHTLPLTLAHTLHAAPGNPNTISPRVVEVAAMFGLGADPARTVPLLPPTQLTLRPGQIIFVTGPSGGGKSTLLRLIRQHAQPRPGITLIDFADLPPPADTALVDAVDAGALPLDRVLRLLSLAGLNDAFVMLRRPGELSDGQRHRLRLAQAMALVELQTSPTLTVILADEFGATLDRITAAVLARNVRRWVGAGTGSTSRFASQTRLSGGVGETSGGGGVCFIAATTHDDLLEPLQPDVLIEKHLGEGIEILEARHD